MQATKLSDKLYNLKLQAFNTYSDLNFVHTTLQLYYRKIQALKSEVNALLNQQEVIKSAQTYYQKAVDIIYQEALGSLEDFINKALQAIFYDQNLKFRIELVDYRGTKTLRFLISQDGGPYLPLKDSTGQGIRSVISFFLLSYILIKKNSPFLFVDEKYSNISESYLPRFMEIVRSFCKENNLFLVLVTHDNRFLPYADRVYTVSHGNVKLVSSQAQKGVQS